MMKRKLLAVLMCLCLLMLAGCKTSEPQRFDYYGNSGSQSSQGGQPTDAPTDAPQGDIDYDSGDYDPSSEEGIGDDDFSLVNVGASSNAQPTDAPTVYSQFAGATPVRIDPIDKPTPTPVPPLTFTYQAYDATNLGLSFEGPIGWTVDASASDAYTIYNPDPSVDYTATLTLRATSVTTQYSEDDLAKEVKSLLSTIGSSGFSTWNPSNTAPRTLIGYPGVYANYTGVLTDGTEVAGRVHATYANNTLYTLHITYPRAYTETYKDGVYDKVRNTITIIK